MWPSSLLLLALPAVHALLSTSHIPATAQSAISKAQFISQAHGFDAPKVGPINDTVFDWWYFDAVSTTDKSSVVVTFFTATAVAFPFLNPGPVVTSVYIWTSTPEGSTSSFVVNATSASVLTITDGASGVWEGAASFAGTPDMSTYVVLVDAPEAGVTGSMYLKSRAPAHYPCGPAKAGQNMELLPHIGWANAVPDATAEVNFEVLGDDLSFTGAGYHDKNWADRPFAETVGSWLWGHARLGPYSLVWFDALDSAGTEHVSGYVVKGGKRVASTCDTTSFAVRLSGADADVWPPTGIEPAGFSIEFDMGDEGVLEVVAQPELVVAGSAGAPYTRWIGNITGTLGNDSLSGVALFEQFALS